jgi:Flp pilus assembly protein TadG
VYKRRLKTEFILKNKCIKQDGRMNTSQSSKNLKKRAQALVEFALIVPVLMMILYGVIETGRYVFIYASTVTAARQAVRYATALGTNASGTPYYNDCVGIRAAVDKVGFLNKFQSVSISYDAGLDGSGNPIPIDYTKYCPPSGNTNSTFTPAGNGDRVVVEVTTEWKPIISLLPFKPFTIKSSSERTILSEIEIEVTPTPLPNSAILTLAVTPSTGTYTTVGQGFSFTYTVSNTGPTPPADPITNIQLTRSINGGFPTPVTCTPTTPMLPSTPAFSCPVDVYEIQPSDIGVGKTVTIVVTATGYPSKSVSQTITLTYVATASLYLAKTADPLPADVPVGTNIHYNYAITNNGNVTVSTITVTDNKTTVDCSKATGTLAPGGVTYCEAYYPITADDTGAGSITNTATAHAIFNATVINSNNASLTVNIPQQPALSMVKSSTTVAAAGTGISIPYKYTITNTGNVKLTNLSVTDDKITSVNCSGAPATLNPGDSGQWCSATYITTAADVTAGQVVNTARAQAKFGTTNVYSAYKSLTIYTTNLVVTVTPTPATVTAPNQTVSYKYTLFNTSSNPISGIVVTNSKGTAPVCPTSVAAGATVDCPTNGNYTVSQDEYDKGMSILNTVQATGSGGVNSNTFVSTVPITQSPASMTVVITSNPTQPTSGNVMAVNDLITFTYKIKNTGNVTLTASASAITPTLDPSGTHTFTTSCAGELAPNAEKTCTGTHNVSADDIDMGTIHNVATATAPTKYNTQTAPTATGTVDVITFLGPRYKLTVSQNQATIYPSNLALTYTYKFLNTGTVTLSRPSSVTSIVTATLTISGTGGTSPYTSTVTADCSSQPLNFPPGSFIECTGVYSHPSGMGSSNLSNSSFNATIVENPAHNTPSAVTATAYNCTSQNFAVGNLTVGTGSNRNKVTWALTNTIGTTVPISSIIINWTGSNRLTGLALNNSSTITNLTLPDLTSPYTSSTGTLTGSSSGASVTTATFTFQSNDPSVTASITLASPYNCTRSK